MNLKFFSCQPDEFSLEGQQWGGGRGVFSYFYWKDCMDWQI